MELTTDPTVTDGIMSISSLENSTFTPDANFTMEVDSGGNYTDLGNATDDMWSTWSSTLSMTTASTTTTETPCYTYSNPPCDALVAASLGLLEYGIYVAYVLGIPGSILTLIVLARMRPFNSSSAWLCCLSCVDLFGLSMRVVLSIFLALTENWAWQTWWCRFYYIMARSTKHVSFFCLVGLTVERFIAVWFPLKMQIWCTIRRALICFFGIFVVIVATELHMIETRRVGPKGTCVIRAKYRPFWQDTYEKYVLTTFYETVPIVALIVLNIMIAARLRSSRKVAKKMSEEQAKEKDKQQRQIDRMLVAATTVFCVFVAPEVLFQYTELLWGPTDRATQFYRDRARFIVVSVTNTFVVLNHAVNFILYVLVAGKFRAEIIRMFTCGKYVGFRQRADGSVKKALK